MAFIADDDDISTERARRDDKARSHAHALTQGGILDFGNAYWGDDKCSDIVDAVRRATQSVQLDLRGNRFEAAGAKVLAEMLKTQHRVVSLCLEWNNVGLLDEGVEALAAALEVDSRLLDLDLRNNNIGPEGAKALAKALKRNRTLRKLDLRWNEIGNAGVLAFLEALQSNHSLLTLELTGNNSSFKHAEDIETLLTRNRSIQGQQLTQQEPEMPASPVKQSSSGHGDQLLLQVLAEKDGLETDLNVAKRYNAKMVEKVEECELQLTFLRKEVESVKQDRDRYQQREIDAKTEAHDTRMRLEELETRRRVEFEEYRASRSALERECTVLREKMDHSETLYQKSDDQKSKQLAQLEETKYRLESEVHRLQLSSASQVDDYQKLKKELLDAAKEFERKEQSLVATHNAETAAATRDHEYAITALKTQLNYSNDQLRDAKQSLSDIKDKHDTLLATLLQDRVAHEKQLHDLKRQWDSESQERLQKSIMVVEAQVEEIKKSRVFLEREVEKHVDTIVRLRQENMALQQAQDERLQELQQELSRQYKELQEKQDQLQDAHREATRANEKTQQTHRRFEEQERTAARMKDNYEERVRDLTVAAEAAKSHHHVVLQEKCETIARLESQIVRVERALTQQAHAHEQRMDGFAESVAAFVQQELKREHERRPQAPTKMDVMVDGGVPCESTRAESENGSEKLHSQVYG